MSGTATLSAPTKKNSKRQASSCNSEKTSSCSHQEHETNNTCTQHQSNNQSNSLKQNQSNHTTEKKKSSHTSNVEVVAKADIGWGNTLYIRGEGASLNWDQGQAMQHNGSEWTWKGTTNPNTNNNNLTFKLLINDQIWSTGDNLNATAGSKTVTEPTF